jgi:hypothetical protein
MEELTVRGPFDLPAAIALQAKLKDAPDWRTLQVDFSHAEVSHIALAGLGAWLSSRGLKVLAVGLREADLQMLRFLGFSRAFACDP